MNLRDQEYLQRLHDCNKIIIIGMVIYSTCPFEDDLLEMRDVDYPPLGVLVPPPLLRAQGLPPLDVWPHSEVDLNSQPEHRNHTLNRTMCGRT